MSNDKCNFCNKTLNQINEEQEHSVGMTKVKRWPGDAGVWQCDPCKEFEDETADLDLDEHEEKKRERIARENEY